MAKSKKQKSQPKDPQKGEMGNFFVKYPPKLNPFPKDLSFLLNAYGRNNSNHLKLLSLVHTIVEHRRTHDPRLAAQCLVLSHELHMYPPVDVLAWLHKGMQAFLHPFKREKEKKLRLDVYLGLNKKPGPKSPPLTTLYYEFIWNDLIVWQKALGLHQYQAFGVVAPHYLGMTAALFEDFSKHKKRHPLWHQCRRKRELFWDLWLRDHPIDQVINMAEFINNYDLKTLKEAKDADGNPIVLDDKILQLHREYQSKNGGRKRG